MFQLFQSELQVDNLLFLRLEITFEIGKFRIESDEYSSFRSELFVGLLVIALLLFKGLLKCVEIFLGLSFTGFGLFDFLLGSLEIAFKLF